MEWSLAVSVCVSANIWCGSPFNPTPLAKEASTRAQLHFFGKPSALPFILITVGIPSKWRGFGSFFFVSDGNDSSSQPTLGVWHKHPNGGFLERPQHRSPSVQHVTHRQTGRWGADKEIDPHQSPWLRFSSCFRKMFLLKEKVAKDVLKESIKVGKNGVLRSLVWKWHGCWWGWGDLFLVP